MSTVTVLIAVYAKDDAALFRASLWSNVLEQTRAPDQLVVAVDGPIGAAIEAVLGEASTVFNARFGAGFMTIVRQQENQGVAAAINRAIPYCRGDLIARADADDLSYLQRFALQTALLDQHPDIDVVTAWQHDFKVEAGRIVATNTCPEFPADIAALLQTRNPVCHPSMLIRAAVFRTHGGYSEAAPLLEDYELHLRWTAQGVRYRCLQLPLVRVTVSEALYGRRGGLAYARREFRFRMDAARRGLFKRGARFYGVTAMYLVFRAIPAGVRKRLYGLVRVQHEDSVSS